MTLNAAAGERKVQIQLCHNGQKNAYPVVIIFVPCSERREKCLTHASSSTTLGSGARIAVIGSRAGSG